MSEPSHLRFMQQLGRSYRAFVAGFESHTGHTLARWRILSLLDRKGELSQKALVQELGTDPAALTRQLKALQEQGWIARNTDAVDGRLINVALTELGRSVVQATMARRDEYMESALGEFSPDVLEGLTQALERMEQRLSRRMDPRSGNAAGAALGGADASGDVRNLASDASPGQDKDAPRPDDSVFF